MVFGEKLRGVNFQQTSVEKVSELLLGYCRDLLTYFKKLDSKKNLIYRGIWVIQNNRNLGF